MLRTHEITYLVNKKIYNFDNKLHHNFVVANGHPYLLD